MKFISVFIVQFYPSNLFNTNKRRKKEELQRWLLHKAAHFNSINKHGKIKLNFIRYAVNFNKR